MSCVFVAVQDILCESADLAVRQTIQRIVFSRNRSFTNKRPKNFETPKKPSFTGFLRDHPLKRRVWWPWPESNRHARYKLTILSRVRLPIPPQGLKQSIETALEVIKNHFLLIISRRFLLK